MVHQSSLGKSISNKTTMLFYLYLSSFARVSERRARGGDPVQSHGNTCSCQVLNLVSFVRNSLVVRNDADLDTVLVSFLQEILNAVVGHRVDGNVDGSRCRAKIGVKLFKCRIVLVREKKSLSDWLRRAQIQFLSKRSNRTTSFQKTNKVKKRTKTRFFLRAPPG